VYQSFSLTLYSQIPSPMPTTLTDDIAPPAEPAAWSYHYGGETGPEPAGITATVMREELWDVVSSYSYSHSYNTDNVYSPAPTPDPSSHPSHRPSRHPTRQPTRHPTRRPSRTEWPTPAPGPEPLPPSAVLTPAPTGYQTVSHLRSQNGAHEPESASTVLAIVLPIAALILLIAG